MTPPRQPQNSGMPKRRNANAPSQDPTMRPRRSGGTGFARVSAEKRREAGRLGGKQGKGHRWQKGSAEVQEAGRKGGLTTWYPGSVPPATSPNAPRNRKKK